VFEAQPGEVMSLEIKRGDRTLIVPLTTERAVQRH